MNQNIWIELEKTIEDQLKLQVDLSLIRHHNFMIEHGLSDRKKVVDIGTGNGLFLEKIAEKHPQILFNGIDNKSHMIKRAETRDLPNCL
ncbi:MAG: methyltransferase domain-containing protein [Deltaproteobacteria bacterium]|nr:methyltransferase domain-containing protein [Deltaproteobacteria bacterium]